MQDEEAAARDAQDIDSTAFNVADAASDVLSTSSLPELAAKSNKLVVETKTLDREMQELVYNNYNKFISATDTIRRMKDSVGEMESKMNVLVTDMRNMGGSSALVNDRLQENRGKIEKLVGVKRLLLKLEFLFELPLRLKRAMELDAHAQAVRYYTMVSGVLRKYDHIPSLHRIRVEADAIMDGLRGELRGALRERGAGAAPSSSRVVESIRLLVQLDEPRPALRTAFLSHQRAKLLAALAAHAARFAPARPGASASAAPLTAVAGSDGSGLISARAASFYSAAQAARAAVGGDAVAAAAATAAPRLRAPAPALTFLQSLNRSFLDAFKLGAELFVELFEEGSGGGDPSASATVTPDEKRAAHEELLAFARDVFGEYFAAVRQQLSLAPPLPSAAQDSADNAAAAATAGARRTGAARRRRGGAAVARADSGEVAEKAAAPEAAVLDDDDEAAAGNAKSAALAAAAAMGDGDDGAGPSRYTSVTDALKLLLTDVRAAGRCVREAQLGDRAHEAVEAVLRAQLDGLFADVRADVVASLGALAVSAGSLLEAERAKSVVAAGGAAADAAAAHAAAPAAAAHGTGSVGGDASGAAGGGVKAQAGSGNPFGPASTVATAMTAAAAAARAAPADSDPGVALPAYDWIAAAGAALAAAADGASTSISSRIDDALFEAKPLVLAGMRLLPDLARVFSSLVHGQVLGLLYWLASAWEAAADGSHPARVEFAALVVEADLGLTASGGGGAPSGARRGGGANALRTSAAAASERGAAASGAAKRRVTVNFAAAEADSGVTPYGPGTVSGAQSSWSGGGAGAAPPFMLLLAALCQHFSHNGVARALSTMLSALPTRNDLLTMGVVVDNELDGYGSMMDVPDIIKRTQAAGRELLRQFVSMHGARLSGIVRAAMTAAGADASLHAGEPRDVRLFVPVLLEDAAATRKLVAATLGEWNAAATAASARALGLGSEWGGGSASSSSAAAAAAARRTGLVIGAAGVTSTFGSIGGAVGGGSAAAGGSRGLSMDIDRLFSRAAAASPGGDGGSGSAASSSGGAHAVLGAVEFSADSVSRSLLRVVFKATVEWTRSSTLGLGAFQQMQVDLAALHLALPFFAPAPQHSHSGSGGGGSAAAVVSGPTDAYAGALGLEELINEAAVSAAERCTDPRPLDASVAWNVCTRRLAMLNVM